jgi:hypothetical protein
MIKQESQMKAALITNTCPLISSERRSGNFRIFYLKLTFSNDGVSGNPDLRETHAQQDRDRKGQKICIAPMDISG